MRQVTNTQLLAQVRVGDETEQKKRKYPPSCLLLVWWLGSFLSLSFSLTYFLSSLLSRSSFPLSLSFFFFSTHTPPYYFRQPWWVFSFYLFIISPRLSLHLSVTPPLYPFFNNFFLPFFIFSSHTVLTIYMASYSE